MDPRRASRIKERIEYYSLYVQDIPLELLEKDGIKKLLEHYGTISSIILPPNATYAFVNYSTYAEAEAAIRALDKQPPLYLTVKFYRKQKLPETPPTPNSTATSQVTDWPKPMSSLTARLENVDKNGINNSVQSQAENPAAKKAPAAVDSPLTSSNSGTLANAALENVQQPADDDEYIRLSYNALLCNKRAQVAREAYDVAMKQDIEATRALNVFLPRRAPGPDHNVLVRKRGCRRGQKVRNRRYGVQRQLQMTSSKQQRDVNADYTENHSDNLSIPVEKPYQKAQSSLTTGEKYTPRRRPEY